MENINNNNEQLFSPKTCKIIFNYYSKNYPRYKGLIDLSTNYPDMPSIATMPDVYDIPSKRIACIDIPTQAIRNDLFKLPIKLKNILLFNVKNKYLTYHTEPAFLDEIRNTIYNINKRFIDLEEINEIDEIRNQDRIAKVTSLSRYLSYTNFLQKNPSIKAYRKCIKYVLIIHNNE